MMGFSLMYFDETPKLDAISYAGLMRKFFLIFINTEKDPGIKKVAP